jgi:YVTN family beta-propeller protein
MAFAGGIAVTPNGKQAFVTGNALDSHTGYIWVIDTTSNTVVDTRSFSQATTSPFGIAISPDGKNAYVVIDVAFFVSVLFGTSGGPIVVGSSPFGVAFAPDSKHAYVTNGGVSVIDTATGTVVATVPVGSGQRGVAVTPDGTKVYVANSAGGTVSVIDTATNTVAATVPVAGAFGVGIIPPPSGVPFSAFSAKLEIYSGHKPNTDHFKLNASFTLGSASNGIHPFAEPVTLKVGTFTATIPPGSFKIADDQDDQNDQEGGVGMKKFGPFWFHGVIDGVDLRVLIRPTGAKRYALEAEARHADLTGTKNPVPVTLTIGGDSNSVLVKAHIDQKLAGRDDD